ncbi:MAG TPA: winged helix-turn-helix domain-containing protein [Pyrinomonadaceae bacterium]|nr:winged helix-turn-helix domain-containing protein [Pyrinomonadaceae bacterium]
MSLKTNSFEFGAFLLDGKEKVLRHNGKPISITPKALQLLQILVENHGQLVERSHLLNTVWADSFVEEGNLTFTIRLLRKALGDDIKTPRFIETVPRRGYRFIAEVNTISSTIHQPEIVLPKSKKVLASIIGFSILLVSTIAVGSKYLHKETNAPILSAPFSSEKLTTNGKTLHTVISQDGKKMVYTQGSGAEKQSVWLRQLETGNNIEILPPSNDFYYGLALSSDGNFLYFVRYPRGQAGRFDVFRVSIFGGIPTKILSQTEGWISLSPDDSRISFVRCLGSEVENCSLYIADSQDGKNEKKLISRPRPFRIGDNEISTDGKRVVFAVGHSETAANEFGLMEVDIETGAERQITSEKFFNIRNLTQLPNENGLLITASRTSTGRYRIWLISPNGRVTPVTNDSESYMGLSIDKSASYLISNQVREDFQIQLFETENPNQSRNLAEATSVAFTPDGKIIFGSMKSGNYEIWSINLDGSGQRQLTNNPADENWALASPSNNSIFFVSNRTGEMQIWRMDADGSNPKQITRQGGGEPLLVSPDGLWLYYQQNLYKSLWRVPVEGGEEQIILDKRKDQIAVSPDGSQAAFTEYQDGKNVLIIVSLANNQTVKTFRLADERATLFHLKWSADGESLTYILALDQFENNTLWQQQLNRTPPKKIADLGDERISGYAIAADGKSFAISKGNWRHDAVLLKGLK